MLLAQARVFVVLLLFLSTAKCKCCLYLVRNVQYSFPLTDAVSISTNEHTNEDDQEAHHGKFNYLQTQLIIRT